MRTTRYFHSDCRKSRCVWNTRTSDKVCFKQNVPKRLGFLNFLAWPVIEKRGPPNAGPDSWRTATPTNSSKVIFFSTGQIESEPTNYLTCFPWSRSFAFQFANLILFGAHSLPAWLETSNRSSSSSIAHKPPSGRFYKPDRCHRTACAQSFHAVWFVI